MPVGIEILKRPFGEYGIPVGTVFGRGDIKPEISAVDVFCTDMAEFGGTYAGGIENGADGKELRIPDGGNKRFHFFL